MLSSIPLSELVLRLHPLPPEEVVAAARRLRYRDLMVVALMIDPGEPFPDNWIYLHDPELRAGRVQNFGAWSPDMTRPGTTCLGAEYFCFEGDDLWRCRRRRRSRSPSTSWRGSGSSTRPRHRGRASVHVPQAYPVYDRGYDAAVAVLRTYLEGFENLETFGRNGLHRYNNQDHSMVTAILATSTYLDGTAHDVWAVNTEESYLEELDLRRGPGARRARTDRLTA